MRDKRILRIACLLLVTIVVTFAISACELPLPSPMESHVSTETATPEAKATDSPTRVPTNTPVILVLPTDTTFPTATATRVMTTSDGTRTTFTLPTIIVSGTVAASATLTDSIIAVPTATASSTPQVSTSSPTATATRLAVLPSATPTKKTTSTPKPLPATNTPIAISSLKVESTPASTGSDKGISYSLKTGDVILNGDFEEGFDEFGIGKGWQGFDNVVGVYGWSDESWIGLVQNGQHAQMMRINFTADPNQYIGIQQTVPVIKGESYELTIHGLIRSAEGNPEDSNWGYRIQWGLDTKGRDSWEAVQEWYDTGWDDQPLDTDIYDIQEHKATITPPGDSLTLFIRGWRKWGTQDREVDFVIDNTSLVGPVLEREPSNLPATGAPAFNWLLTVFAGSGLLILIFALRQVRGRLASNR